MSTIDKNNNQDPIDKNNYNGSKGAFGMCEFLINHIPVHDNYYELFAGSAQLYKKKEQSNFYDFLNEIEPNQFKKLCKLKSGNKQLVVLNENAFTFLDRHTFYKNDFIYLDPPYPATSRKSQKPIYINEMLDEKRHKKLLEICNTVHANIMISTRQNHLYDIMLGNWHKAEFVSADRSGKVVEIIYMNYDISTLPLHQTDYVGNGCTDRQRIKRKKNRFQKKLAALPKHEREVMIRAVVDNYEEEIRQYLSILQF